MNRLETRILERVDVSTEILTFFKRCSRFADILALNSSSLFFSSALFRLSRIASARLPVSQHLSDQIGPDHLTLSASFSSFSSFSTPLIASRFVSRRFRFANGVFNEGEMKVRRVGVLDEWWAFPGDRPSLDAARGRGREDEADGLSTSILERYTVYESL